MCVHGFFTAPNLGVDVRGAQRTGAGTGGDEAVGQSLEQAGKTSVPSLYSRSLSTRVSGLVPCLHPQAFLASAPAAQPLDWLFPLPGGPTPYSIQQGQRGCAQACLVPGAVGEELPDSLRPCPPPHKSGHCLTSYIAELDQSPNHPTVRVQPDPCRCLSALTTTHSAFPGVHGPWAPHRLSGPERCVSG